VETRFLEACVSSKISRLQSGVLILAMTGLVGTRPLAAAPRQEPSASSRTLDYEFFKNRVEPIFLKRRPGHARCYACHASGTGPQYLVPMSPGNASWTEEQSRRVFRNVSAMVDRDDPMSSLFLIHPLSPLAGGDIQRVHGGGRQFESKDDPDWKTIKEWVNGAKATTSSEMK
jgi:hypothetical protein